MCRSEEGRGGEGRGRNGGRGGEGREGERVAWGALYAVYICMQLHRVA